MEAFTLLRYWRTGGGTARVSTRDSSFTAGATTRTVDTPSSHYGEDGPYFDLEFSFTNGSDEAADNSPENVKTPKDTESESGSSAEELSEKVQFSLTDDELGADHNLTLSPSDGLFFKGHLLPCLDGSEENSKIPASLLRSATMFRVLLLKLKKSKSANWVSEKTEDFTDKLKVEDVNGPLVSLFASHNNYTKDSNVGSDERKLTRELVHKYLKMLKPLYIRVSSRYVEKMKFSVQLNFRGGGPRGGEAAALRNLKSKQGKNHLQAGLKVVSKHLDKNQSTSAAVMASPPGQMAAGNRRCDSLVELQDGIQGAILHCKRSFNASRDGESAVLSRSASDPSYDKSAIIPTASSASTSLFSGDVIEIKVN